MPDVMEQRRHSVEAHLLLSESILHVVAEVRQDEPRYMECSDAVRKARVVGTRENETSQPEMLDAPKSLEGATADDRRFVFVEENGAMDTVRYAGHAHAVSSLRGETPILQRSDGLVQIRHDVRFLLGKYIPDLSWR